MKWLLLIFLMGVQLNQGIAQQLTLDECLNLALQSSPMADQQALYTQLAESKTQRLGKAYLPQPTLNGQWSYQSDVFSLPFSPPGTDIPEIPKSQYQLTVGVEQQIYDGGAVRQSKEAALRELQVNQQKTEADLYKVKEAVSSLYFGILRTQETENNLQTALETLEQRKKEVDAAYNNGVLLLSDKATFEKEVLMVEQQLIALQAEKKALLEMLGAKLGQPVPPDAVLQLPSYDGIGPELAVDRPEIRYLNEQKMLISQNSQVLDSKGKPKLSAFARGGAGSPNPYNFFETDFSGFYIAGVRLYWTIFDWGATKQEQQELLLQEKLLENSRQDLVQQFESGGMQWLTKWEAMEDIIARDAQIVQLQEAIVSEYNLRLEGGTVTSSDYIAALDQLTRAKITTRMHELDRAWYQIQFLTITGKL